jgi:hypothetical protein
MSSAFHTLKMWRLPCHESGNGKLRDVMYQLAQAIDSKDGQAVPTAPPEDRTTFRRIERHAAAYRPFTCQVCEKKNIPGV